MIDPLIFAAMATLVVAAPGPAVAHVVGCALIGGLRIAAAAIAGLALGQVALVVLSLSAGAALHEYAGRLIVAQALAGVVLLLIGLRAMLRATDAAAPARFAGSRAGAAIAGFGIVVSNPISLPFLASLAVATSDGTVAPWPEVAMLAAAYAGIGVMVYFGYALGAARLARAGQAVRWRIAMRGLAGASIAAAGLFCLVRAVGA